MQTETRKLAELKPDPQNARTHDERNLEAITESLTRFGQRKPIVITPEGVILAGNGTYTAATKLGWNTIEVAVTPADWDYATARAYALADNRSAELAAWEPRILADQLVELDAEGWDITALGFDLPTTLLPDAQPEDDTPLTFDENAPTIAQPGDLWQLGNHRLHCGDSTTAHAFKTLLGDELADLIVTDPPYGVSYTGGQNETKREMLANDDGDVFAESIPLGYAHSKPEAALYVWFAGSKGHLAFNAVQAADYTVRAMCFWHKLKAHYGAYMSQYMPKHEPVLYCHKTGQSPKWRGPTNEVTVWEYEQPARNEWHPTQKPVEVMARAIKNSSDQGDIILDYFGGSGSTLIACEQTHRHARLIELDPKYCDAIIKRWEQYTGKTATRITTEG